MELSSTTSKSDDNKMKIASSDNQHIKKSIDGEEKFNSFDFH